MKISEQDIFDALRSDCLHLIIMPTEKCNFRCTYCYEEFSIGKMSQNTVESIKTLLARRFPELRHLSIGWFGGEPLLAFGIIDDLSSFIIENAHSDVSYTASMSTNGSLLTLEKLKRLSTLRVRQFQISLDGNDDMHDRTRLTINKRGSFEKIWRRLIDAYHSDIEFNITLRVHLSRQNISTVEELINKIYKTFHSDDRFDLYFKAIEPLGSTNDGEFPFLSGEKKESWTQYFETYARNLGLLCERAKSNICYASKANSFVIRANGGIAKCTVALYNDVNDIGLLKSDGTVEIIDSKFQKWISGLMHGDADRAYCPLGAIVK